MHNATSTDAGAENKREWRPHEKWNDGEAKHMGFKSNHVLHNIIIDIANERRASISSTIIMLLYLGKEQYKLNKKLGIDTTVKRKQNKAKQEAEAMAKAAERERKKNSKKPDTITAVTPMLFNGKDENEQ